MAVPPTEAGAALAAAAPLGQPGTQAAVPSVAAGDAELAQPPQAAAAAETASTASAGELVGSGAPLTGTHAAEEDGEERPTSHPSESSPVQLPAPATPAPIASLAQQQQQQQQEAQEAQEAEEDTDAEQEVSARQHPLTTASPDEVRSAHDGTVVGVPVMGGAAAGNVVRGIVLSTAGAADQADRGFHIFDADASGAPVLVGGAYARAEGQPGPGQLEFAVSLYMASPAAPAAAGSGLDRNIMSTVFKSARTTRVIAMFDCLITWLLLLHGYIWVLPLSFGPIAGAYAATNYTPVIIAVRILLLIFTPVSPVVIASHVIAIVFHASAAKTAYGLMVQLADLRTPELLELRGGWLPFHYA
eukprot:TRINITY_DN11004_c0_g1_i2.p2 TRINITY_DN11004_c0_g1~~TRINITY_DN11004_c0_g1_i2.p2  ORF type:complete len:383 (+),score=103.51 TRINITY_DN11004_c0_g1_i2:75-1151(+)